MPTPHLFVYVEVQEEADAPLIITQLLTSPLNTSTTFQSITVDVREKLGKANNPFSGEVEFVVTGGGTLTDLRQVVSVGSPAVQAGAGPDTEREGSLWVLVRLQAADDGVLEQIKQLKVKLRGLAAHVGQVDRKVTGQVDLLSQQMAREGDTQSEAGAGMMGPSQPPAGEAAPAFSHRDGSTAMPSTRGLDGRDRDRQRQ